MHSHLRWIALFVVVVIAASAPVIGQPKKVERFLDPIDVKVPHISTDQSVKYDYDIVYVRTPRKGDKARSVWTEIAHPAIVLPERARHREYLPHPVPASMYVPDTY